MVQGADGGRCEALSLVGSRLTLVVQGANESVHHQLDSATTRFSRRGSHG